MTPIFFAELPAEYRSLMSFAARRRGTPKASAVSIGVGNREVILIAIVLNSSYIFRMDHSNLNLRQKVRDVSPHSASILHRAGVGLKTLPQFFELGRVGEEGAVAVDDFVGQDGLPAVGGGDVGARRPVPCFGLLFGREVPREEKYGGVWMRCGFEDGRGERPDWKRIGLREGDGLRQGQIFLVYADAGDGIEGDSVSSAE